MSARESGVSGSASIPTTSQENGGGFAETASEQPTRGIVLRLLGVVGLSLVFNPRQTIEVMKAMHFTDGDIKEMQMFGSRVFHHGEGDGDG